MREMLPEQAEWAADIAGGGHKAGGYVAGNGPRKAADFRHNLRYFDLPVNKLLTGDPIWTELVGPPHTWNPVLLQFHPVMSALCVSLFVQPFMIVSLLFQPCAPPGPSLP